MQGMIKENSSLFVSRLIAVIKSIQPKGHPASPGYVNTLYRGKTAESVSHFLPVCSRDQWNTNALFTEQVCLVPCCIITSTLDMDAGAISWKEKSFPPTIQPRRWRRKPRDGTKILICELVSSSSPSTRDMIRLEEMNAPQSTHPQQ